jgi:hypothetical protein
MIVSYRNSSLFYNSQIKKGGELYKKKIDKDQLAILILNKYLEEVSKEEKYNDDYNIQSFLKLLFDKERNEWKYNCACLLLLIYGTLPEFVGKKNIKREKFNINKAYKEIITLLSNYFAKRSIFEQLPELIEAEKTKEDIDKDPNLHITIVKLIATVQDILNEYERLRSSQYMMEINDENRTEHENFCEKHYIEGVWQDNRHNYWSIQKMADYCIMYEFLNYGGQKVEYKRYSLITRTISKDTASFTIIPADEIQKVFSGGKMDANNIHNVDVRLKNDKKAQGKTTFDIVKEIIVDESTPKIHFNKLTRVDKTKSNIVKNWWNEAIIREAKNATFYFCFTMTAITKEYIYVGSFDRDENGICSFFYQLSKSVCMDMKEVGDRLYYTDFCQLVGIIRSYTNNKDNKIIHKDYLANDALGIYIDVTDIESIPIDEKNKETGIRKISKDELSKFVELDEQPKVYPKELSDIGIFSPFNYSIVPIL